MAYAGNPSDLTKPAAPTGSGQYSGSWQPLLAAIIVMVIIVVVAMAPVLNRTQILHLDDERGGTSLSIAPTSIVPVDRTLERSATLQAGVSRMVYQGPLSLAPADNSLSSAERLLSAASTFTPKSFVPADNSLAKAERLQSDVSRMVYRTVAPLDHRYDNIQNLRGNLR
jgi:hypothetical protein